MASKREEMETLTHGALADIIASGSPLAPFATAELERRTTVYQEDAAHFQELAAEAQQEAAGAAKDTARYTQEAAGAAKDTARYTQEGARYMRWSVIVLAIASAVTAFFSVWDHFFRP
jgi:hypothetical protein